MKRQKLIAGLIALVAIVGMVVWVIRDEAPAKYKQLLPDDPMILSYVDPVEVLNSVNLSNIDELQLIPQQFSAENCGLDLTQRIYPFVLNLNTAGVLAAVKNKDDVMKTLTALAKLDGKEWNVEEKGSYTLMYATEACCDVNIAVGLTGEAVLLLFSPSAKSVDYCVGLIADRFEHAASSESVSSDLFKQLECKDAIMAFTARYGTLIECMKMAGSDMRNAISMSLMSKPDEVDYNSLIAGGHLTAGREKVVLTYTLYYTDEKTKAILSKRNVLEKVDGNMLPYVPENSEIVLGLNLQGEVIAEQLPAIPMIQGQIQQVDNAVLAKFGTTLNQLFSSLQGEMMVTAGGVEDSNPNVTAVFTTEDNSVIDLMKAGIPMITGENSLAEIAGNSYSVNVRHNIIYFGKKEKQTYVVCGDENYQTLTNANGTKLDAYKDKIKGSYFYMYLQPSFFLTGLRSSQRNMLKPMVEDACNVFLVTAPSTEEVNFELYLNPENDFVAKYLK